MLDETLTATVDWAAVQRDYEQGDARLVDIYERHGVTAAQLRYRRETHNWKPRHNCNQRVAPMINRMLRALDNQVRQLEKLMSNEVDEAGESRPETRLDKNAALLSIMTRTLEKLIEIDGAQRAGRPTQNKQTSDIRNKLVARIEQLKQQR